MAKSKLISPHGSATLKTLLLEGKKHADELKKAETLPKVQVSSRETGDLIVLGIGGLRTGNVLVTKAA